MALIDFVKLPALVSLAIVLGLLAGSMLASWWVAHRRRAALPSTG
jgi:hypothetical protein